MITIKARRWYASVAADMCGRPEERDYVTGFAMVNGERWCRVSDGPGKRSRVLVHPSMLRPVADGAAACEICGKAGKDARKCTFEKCCSCWRGIPCEQETQDKAR